MTNTKTLKPINDGKTARGHVCTCAGCGAAGVYCDTDHGIVRDDGTEILVEFGQDLVPLLVGRADGSSSDSLYCADCE